jgi:hypothetical protein
MLERGRVGEERGARGVKGREGIEGTGEVGFPVDAGEGGGESGRDELVEHMGDTNVPIGRMEGWSDRIVLLVLMFWGNGSKEADQPSTLFYGLC